MQTRLLIITDQLDFARFIEHHLRVFWDNAQVRVHSLATAGDFHPAFTAAAFDLVVLDELVAESRGEQYLVQLSSRADFPPIVYCCTNLNDATEEQLLHLGASGAFGRTRIDNHHFASTMRGLLARRRREMERIRARSDAERGYIFGSVMIRGQRFIQEIGKGATSQVYLAESEKAGEVVVLKVIGDSQETADTHEGYDRFMQEYELLSQIEHRNVVKIYDIGISDDHAYIAMEYFAAGSLRQRMNQSLTVAEILDCIEQMARALEAVHAVGVLHRDIKPGNIMLRGDGSLALIDFGLAKILEGDVALTAAGEIFGTPYYMSPEQGHGEIVDARSDLYSVGVVLYEMLMNKKPYMSTTIMNVIYLHRNAPLPELASEFAHLQPLVHRLLAKKPEDRYQTATELLADIQQLRV